jgi:MarR family transcriptional regulator, organic hydroperoxide resistance regulator
LSRYLHPTVAVTADSKQRFSDAWESFFRTTRRLRARAGRLPGEAHMSLPQYLMLEPLRAGDELPVGELAEAAGVAAPTATRMLDCLARDGFITRRHSETDRRVVLVGLTAAGEEAVETAHRHVDAWRGRVLDSLEPEEREQAAVLMERLSQVLAEQL